MKRSRNRIVVLVVMAMSVGVSAPAQGSISHGGVAAFTSGAFHFGDHWVDQCDEMGVGTPSGRGFASSHRELAYSLRSWAAVTAEGEPSVRTLADVSLCGTHLGGCYSYDLAPEPSTNLVFRERDNGYARVVLPSGAEFRVANVRWGPLILTGATTAVPLTGDYIYLDKHGGRLGRGQMHAAMHLNDLGSYLWCDHPDGTSQINGTLDVAFLPLG